MAGRGAWKKSRHRRLPRFCSDAVSHIALQCADASFCYRARRGGVENAGGIEPACTDAPDGAPPPWGTQRRARHRRMTTVSSTSGGFHRRRRRRLLLRGRQAAGRGTTFGAGCAAQHAASAPSPPHLHSTRARSAPSIRAARARAGQSLRVRAQLLRSARASRRAAKGAGRLMANGEMVGSNAVLRRAWSRPQRGAEARACARCKKKVSTHGRSTYPERLLRSPFSGSPG